MCRWWAVESTTEHRDRAGGGGCLPHKSFKSQYRTSLPSGLVRTSLEGADTAPDFRLLRMVSETESPGQRVVDPATSARFFKTGAPSDPRWAGSIPVRLCQ